MASREHRVRLSGRALEILAEALALSNGKGFVLPEAWLGRPLSENTDTKHRELSFDAVTRGCRSSFRNYAPERTHKPHG